jgi:serine phosphatase RsbU (regulator of sigma subunit)
MSPESNETPAGAEAGPPRHILEVRSPEGATLRVPLVADRYVIGRAADARIRLESELVSRSHAELVRDPFGRWWIRDMGSHNGTLVSGIRVQERMLRPGGVIEIGPFTLRLTGEEDLRDSRGTGSATPVPVLDETSASTSALADLQPPRLAASHLSKLMAFGRRLIEVESADQRLRLLCDLMVSADFRGQWVAVLRLKKDAPDEPPRMLCEPAVGPDLADLRPHISRGLLRAALARGEPLLASNLPVGPVDVQLSLAASVQAMSAMVCPLRADAKVLDVLYAILPPQFDASEWLALAALAAEEFGQAEFAWASSRQAQAYARIEADLEQAAGIQKRLIPRDLSAPGLDVAIRFEPCRWIGGDYVDLVPMPDGRTLLAIADVCGKGMQAALVAASVHSLVHASVRTGAGPVALMAVLNEHLAEHLPAGSFVTLLAVAAAPGAEDLEIVNAGHPPAVIVDRAGGIRWTASGTNLPLGLGTDPFQAQAERLAAGEIMAMFTDGVTDLQAARRRRLGTPWIGEQIRSIYAAGGGVAACDVAERLAAEVQRVLAGGLADDDRTFLLARRV